MKKKSLIIVTLLLALCFITSFPVMAASKSKTAKKAYREAINNGQIRIPSKTASAVKDANGDGYPELMLLVDQVGEGPTFKIYTYKGGKVSLLVNHTCEWTMHYNASKKTFYEIGEGGGGWRIDYKLVNNSLKEVGRYFSEYYNGVHHSTKTVSGVTTKIPFSEYQSAVTEAVKKDALKKRSKAALLKLLK